MFSPKFLCPVCVIELPIVHAVHDGHQLLELSLTFLLAPLGHEVLAEARDHPHDLAEGPHLHHVGELLVHVPQGEFSVLNLLHQLGVILVQAELPDRRDKTLEVSHPQQLLDKCFGLELFEVIYVFSCSNEYDWRFCASHST